MSSISSASSRISTSSRSSFSVPRRMWSSARPGVATTMLAPRSSARTLLKHRRAAVERQHAQSAAARVLVHRFGDLHGQLARRDEHEPVGAPAIVGPEVGDEGGDAVQHRQRERRRLARAGCGLREQVEPFEQQRNRLALNRRWLLVSKRRHRRDDRIVQPEGGESGRGGLRFGRSTVGHASWHCTVVTARGSGPTVWFFGKEDVESRRAHAMAFHVNYDSIAATYDRRYLENDYSGVERALTAFVGPNVTGRVLEVGCGTGHWLQLLGESGIRVAGVDASGNMLTYARARARGAALAHGRAEHLPWASQTFERVFCINAFHHFEDKVGFLTEARRVLVPGGQRDDRRSGSSHWY